MKKLSNTEAEWKKKAWKRIPILLLIMEENNSNFLEKLGFRQSITILFAKGALQMCS